MDSKTYQVMASAGRLPDNQADLKAWLLHYRAERAVHPAAGAARVVCEASDAEIGDEAFAAVLEHLTERASGLCGRNPAVATEMLACQAVALDTMFASLAERGLQTDGEQGARLVALALAAQEQARHNVEAIQALKSARRKRG